MLGSSGGSLADSRENSIFPESAKRSALPGIACRSFFAAEARYSPTARASIVYEALSLEIADRNLENRRTRGG
jgi:hypothetical protein